MKKSKSKRPYVQGKDLWFNNKTHKVEDKNQKSLVDFEKEEKLDGQKES